MKRQDRGKTLADEAINQIFEKKYYEIFSKGAKYLIFGISCNIKNVDSKLIEHCEIYSCDDYNKLPNLLLWEKRINKNI